MITNPWKTTICKSICCFSTLLFLFSCSSDSEKKENGGISDEEMEAISETAGHMIVENLNAGPFKINYASFIQGIEDAQSGIAPPLDKETYGKLISEHAQKIQALQSSENLKNAETFLASNKNKEGVTSLENGKLQYITLEPGNGTTVTDADTPLLEYEGTYIDGKIFDSTKKKGEPMALSLKSTIPGFKMGVIGMKEGETRRIFIHPDLGYGTAGRLPPNSLLIFKIEVVKANTKGAKDKSAESETDNHTSDHWLKKLKGPMY